MIRYCGEGTSWGGESTVQETVDIMWFSYPDDEVFLVEEWDDGAITAIWRVPSLPGSTSPPTAVMAHREEVQ